MKPNLRKTAVSTTTLAILGAGLFTAAVTRADSAAPAKPAAATGGGNEAEINRNAQAMLAEGRKIFRYDTFGSEAF